MGKVEHLITGKDGVVRGASVLIISKGKQEYLNRPLTKLYPLEITKKRENDGEESEDNNEKTERRMVRPRRAAAADAMWLTRSMLDSD